MLKESDDHDIFGVPFNYKMTFEKHLLSVFRASFQTLGITGSLGKYLMIDHSCRNDLVVWSCSF